jgi:nucleotide-binding universal stress UspA family protein
MFKHILLPVDDSALSQKAVAAAIEFARESGARVTPYTCLLDQASSIAYAGAPFGLVQGTDLQRREEAQATINQIEQAAAAAGVSCMGVVSEAASPHLGIIDTAKQMGCDVIFMASHARKGVAGLLLGSETQKVLGHSTIPVLVFR